MSAKQAEFGEAFKGYLSKEPPQSVLLSERKQCFFVRKNWYFFIPQGLEKLAETLCQLFSTGLHGLCNSRSRGRFPF